MIDADYKHCADRETQAVVTSLEEDDRRVLVLIAGFDDVRWQMTFRTSEHLTESDREAAIEALRSALAHLDR